MIKSKKLYSQDLPSKQEASFAQTNQLRYQQNKKTLDRLLSLRSLERSCESPSKYKAKYRQLKRTYNDLLSISKKLQQQYQEVIESMKKEFKEQKEQLSTINRQQIKRLNQNIRVLSVGMQQKQKQLKVYFKQKTVQEANLKLLEDENYELSRRMQELKKDNYIYNIQKQKILLQNSYQMHSINGILDKLDLITKQLEFTKQMLDSQKEASKLIRKQLEQCKFRMEAKVQENHNLIKQQEIKSRTINDLEKLVNLSRSFEGRNRLQNTMNHTFNKQTITSPKKGRIVMEIHQMIQNYKRNIKDY